MRAFHQELERMTLRVLEMGTMARRNLDEGVRALLAEDRLGAQAVIKREDALNRLDVEIERDVLDLLALNQPMAQDLRVAGASLKIISYLDRIGRYGYDIAKAQVEAAPSMPPAIKHVLEKMVEGALRMHDMAMTAYQKRDAAKARAVAAEDDVVDRLYDEALKLCVQTMRDDPATIPACTQAVLVARHLERAADNAQKVAEKTLYIVTGERRLAV